MSSIIGQGQNKFFTIHEVLTRDYQVGGYVVVVHDLEEGVSYPLCHVENHVQAVDAAEDHDIGTDPQATTENGIETLIDAARKYVDGNYAINKGEAQKIAWAIAHVGHEVYAGQIVRKRD